MKFTYFLQILVISGIGLLTWGCQQPRAQAKQALLQELAKRQAAQAQSRRLYERGINAYRASNLELAGEYLEKAIGMDEQNIHAWMVLGIVHFEREKLFEAAHAFHRVSRLEPSRYEPHFNIGTILESVGRYEQAIESYETALKAAPGQLEVMENLARCYLKANQKPDRTRKLIERSLAVEQRPEWRDWLRSQALRLTVR